MLQLIRLRFLPALYIPMCSHLGDRPGIPDCNFGFVWTDQNIRLHGQRSEDCCCCELNLLKEWVLFFFPLSQNCSSDWAWRGGRGNLALQRYIASPPIIVWHMPCCHKVGLFPRPCWKKVQSNNECLTRLINQGWWEALGTDAQRRQGLAAGDQREETSTAVVQSGSSATDTPKSASRQMQRGPMLDQT